MIVKESSSNFRGRKAAHCRDNCHTNSQQFKKISQDPISVFKGKSVLRNKILTDEGPAELNKYRLEEFLRNYLLQAKIKTPYG